MHDRNFRAEMFRFFLLYSPKIDFTYLYLPLPPSPPPSYLSSKPQPNNAETPGWMQEKKAMDVVFQPCCKPKEGEPVSLTQRLKMTVLHNPFDATTFLLLGTCLNHDVIFEDLPSASATTDELVFEQVRQRTRV